MTALPLGRLPNDPTKPRLRLRLTPAGATTPIPTSDWATGVPEWPMYANDRIGSCVPAAAGHIIESLTQYGQGAAVEVTEADVVSAYSAVGGYTPSNPASDQGLIVQDFLGWWRTTGMAGHRIAAFASLDAHDPALLGTALHEVGSLQIGINFPHFAWAQLNQGLPWNDVPGPQATDGGHCVNVVGRTAAGNWVCVTWGRLQLISSSFWARWVDEAWAVLSPEWISTAGGTPSGLDVAGLGAQWSALTGDPSPFPDTPTPAPSPGIDTPTAADSTLADATRVWRGQRHTGSNRKAADAVTTWAASHGLT